MNIAATGGVARSITQPKDIGLDEEVNGTDPKPEQLVDGSGVVADKESRLSNVPEVSPDYKHYEC